MSSVQIIQRLRATHDRIGKEQILIDAWMTGEIDFFIGVKLAFDKLINFGVIKVAQIVDDGGDSDEQPSTFSFSDFNNLAHKLNTRQLTGSSAKDAIDSAAQNSNTTEWNEFFRDILLKDLKLGLTDNNINKILNKISKSDITARNYLISSFGIQSYGRQELKLTGQKMLDLDLNGYRIITVVDKELYIVRQYTYSGIEMDNVALRQWTYSGTDPDQSQTFINVFKQMMPDLPCSMVFVGEVIDRSFHTIMRPNSKVKSINYYLALVDCLPLVDFKRGVCNIGQDDRHSILSGYFGLMMMLSTNGEVFVVPKVTVDLDTDAGKQTYYEYLTDAKDAKYDHIIVKDKTAPYIFKNNINWTKVSTYNFKFEM